MVEAATKRCTGCQRVLPMDEFNLRGDRPSGRRSRCRTCSSKKSGEYNRRNADRVRAWAKADYERRGRAHLRMRKYGITEAQYQEMLERQEGVCALCQQPPKSRPLGVDHCHSTGAVRGLLCVSCNAALGIFGDTVEGLERVIAYLRGELPMASSADITKVSKSAETNIMRQGHSTNGKFGSNPSVPNKNGNVRDLNPPSTGRR